MKRSLSLSDINCPQIEFISLYHNEGYSSYISRDKIDADVLRILEYVSFQYAFINMMGGGFLIVDGIRKQIVFRN